MLCIIGACVCFVHGVRMVYMDFSYHLDFVSILVFSVIPFVPIVAVAPRYRNGSRVYAVIALVELIVITTYPFVVVR